MNGTNPPDPDEPVMDVGRPEAESTLGPSNDPVLEVVPDEDLPPDVLAKAQALRSELEHRKAADADRPSPSPSGEGGDQ